MPQNTVTTPSMVAPLECKAVRPLGEVDLTPLQAPIDRLRTKFISLVDRLLSMAVQTTPPSNLDDDPFASIMAPLFTAVQTTNFTFNRDDNATQIHLTISHATFGDTVYSVKLCIHIPDAGADKQTFWSFRSDQLQVTRHTVRIIDQGSMDEEIGILDFANYQYTAGMIAVTRTPELAQEVHVRYAPLSLSTLKEKLQWGWNRLHHAANLCKELAELNVLLHDAIY